MADDNVINLSDARTTIAELAKLDAVSYGQRRKSAAKDLGISVSILDKEVQKRRRVPTDKLNPRLIYNEKGSIVPILANAVEILQSDESPFKLAYEEFTQRPFLDGQPLENYHLLDIAQWIQRQGCHASKSVTDDAVISVAHQAPFHVVRDWLEALIWDGTSRLDMMLIDHAGAADTEVTRQFTAKWIMQAVARIFLPGCQADATLMLEGPQGVGKSSLFRALFGDEWFSDHLPNLDTKDAQIQLLGIWCIELSELAAFTGKETAKIKQFLSSRDDRFRIPFERIAKNHPRQSVFCGTINPGANGWHKDQTGGRRYWPITVGSVDVESIKSAREQIWAEAFHRFHYEKEIWHLQDGDVADAAKQLQSDRTISDPWHDDISEYITGKHFVTQTEIFEKLGFDDITKRSPQEQRRISEIMTALKWRGTQVRRPSTLPDEKNKPRRGYVPIVEEEKIPLAEDDRS